MPLNNERTNLDSETKAQIKIMRFLSGNSGKLWDSDTNVLFNITGICLVWDLTLTPMVGISTKHWHVLAVPCDARSRCHARPWNTVSCMRLTPTDSTCFSATANIACSALTVRIFQKVSRALISTELPSAESCPACASIGQNKQSAPPYDWSRESQ